MRCPSNSSGISVSVAPGRLADAEREVARLAPHGDDEVPARGRLGVDHQVLDDLDAVVARRLEPERVDVAGQVEVVVDRLRHVDDADAAAGLLLELHRRVGRVVAADRDELRDVQAQQRDDRVLEVLRVLRRVRAGDADVRPAAEVDAADLARSSSGTTWSMLPCMIHSKPSRMPTTSTPSSSARIVAALMTLLMPGAGPPPTRIASFLVTCRSYCPCAITSRSRPGGPGGPAPVVRGSALSAPAKCTDR